MAVLRLCVTVAAMAAGALAAPFEAAADCDRAAMTEATDAYVAAQTAGKLEPLQKVLASSWTYMEDNNELDASKKSVLLKALKIDHRRTNYDMTQCATYTELIVTDTATPYVIGTQLWIGADKKVTKIDTIASTTNSWIFDAKKTLDWVQKESWEPIAEGKRDNRDLIKAVGDAWLDMWSNSTAADKIPWGTPCSRLEGSAYTGKGKADDSCKPGIPSNHNQAPNTHRRYVIDEAMGSVDIFCRWEHMMNAADNHEFRLENGKLRYVHTMTVCPNGQACKLGKRAVTGTAINRRA